MISRATSVYIIMLVVFGAGLWAILSFGSILLTAPTDLAGEWDLQSFTSTTPSTPAAAKQMAIEQSGQYFRINVDGKPMSLKRSSERTITNPTGPDRLTITLKGENAEFIFTGQPEAEEYQLQITGSTAPNGTWSAIRTARLYPKRKVDQPSTRPAATTASALKSINPAPRSTS